MSKLEEKKQKYKNSVRIRSAVLVGRPENKIVEFANRQNVDLIAMGSRGLKGISRWVMGSVSRSVSERAKCTVMIVK
jgi:nucleotide-binding universal stress UspA family protein